MSGGTPIKSWTLIPFSFIPPPVPLVNLQHSVVVHAPISSSKLPLNASPSFPFLISVVVSLMNCGFNNKLGFSKEFPKFI